MATNSFSNPLIRLERDVSLQRLYNTIENYIYLYPGKDVTFLIHVRPKGYEAKIRIKSNGGCS
jgi:hypothetical protein